MRIGYISAPEAFDANESDDSPTTVESVSITADRPSRCVDEDAGRSDTAEWQVVSNIADCSADPGTHTVGRTKRADDIHRCYSPECLLRRRVTRNMAPSRPDEAFEFSPDLAGTSAD